MLHESIVTLLFSCPEQHEQDQNQDQHPWSRFIHHKLFDIHLLALISDFVCMCMCMSKETPCNCLHTIICITRKRHTGKYSPIQNLALQLCCEYGINHQYMRHFSFTPKTFRCLIDNSRWIMILEHQRTRERLFMNQKAPHDWLFVTDDVIDNTESLFDEDVPMIKYTSNDLSQQFLDRGWIDMSTYRNVKRFYSHIIQNLDEKDYVLAWVNYQKSSRIHTAV